MTKERLLQLIIGVHDGGTPSLSASATLFVQLEGIRAGLEAYPNPTSSQNPADYRRDEFIKGFDPHGGGGVKGENSYDDSQLIIIVMVVAGCLVVIVAFSLVAALLRKNSSSGHMSNKMAVTNSRTAIVWSKVNTDYRHENAIVLAAMSPPDGHTASANGAVSDVVRYKSTNDLNTACDAANVILTLDSEPVSYAVCKSKPIILYQILHEVTHSVNNSLLLFVFTSVVLYRHEGYYYKSTDTLVPHPHE